jgi:chloride channel 3/4/5
VTSFVLPERCFASVGEDQALNSCSIGSFCFVVTDWIHDFAQERQRIRKLQRQPGLAGQIAVIYNWIQGWVVVLAVGITAGIVAGGSDIASQWLGGVKEGYCATAFYLNRNFCCWGLDGMHSVKVFMHWMLLHHIILD